MENILKLNIISDYIYSISKSDFESEPTCLLLDNMFYNKQQYNQMRKRKQYEKGREVLYYDSRSKQ